MFKGFHNNRDEFLCNPIHGANQSHVRNKMEEMDWGRGNSTHISINANNNNKPTPSRHEKETGKTFCRFSAAALINTYTTFPWSWISERPNLTPGWRVTACKYSCFIPRFIKACWRLGPAPTPWRLCATSSPIAQSDVSGSAARRSSTHCIWIHFTFTTFWVFTPSLASDRRMLE